MSSAERKHDAGRNDAELGDQSAPADQWQQCPAGELTQMVQRLDAAQLRMRRKEVYRTALLSTALFACVVLTVGSLMGPGGSRYGGISCSYCRGHFTEYQLYLAGQVVAGGGVAGAGGDGDRSDDERGDERGGGTREETAFALSMKTHLEKCTFCRERFNAMYPEQRIAGTVMARSRPVFALRPLLEMGRRSYW